MQMDHAEAGRESLKYVHVAGNRARYGSSWLKRHISRLYPRGVLLQSQVRTPTP
jgi:hypothetical protein